MTKRNMYHIDESEGNGYLKQLSTGKYFKIIYKKKDDAIYEDSYYSVEPVEGESKSLLSISGDSVDMGFFEFVSDEEYKIETL